jgi:hypothetical protein
MDKRQPTREIQVLCPDFDSFLMELVRQQMLTLRGRHPNSWADYVEEGAVWEKGLIETLEL